MTSIGDEAQMQAIADRIGKASAAIAIREFVQTHPHFETSAPKPEIPAPLKWAGVIVAGLMSAAVIAMSFWVVSTLNELQLTVREISTRQQTDTTSKRLDAVEQTNAQQTERITALEQGKQR
jgi:hypothetical protein